MVEKWNNQDELKTKKSMMLSAVDAALEKARQGCFIEASLSRGLRCIALLIMTVGRRTAFCRRMYIFWSESLLSRPKRQQEEKQLKQAG